MQNGDDAFPIFKKGKGEFWQNPFRMIEWFLAVGSPAEHCTQLDRKSGPVMWGNLELERPEILVIVIPPKTFHYFWNLVLIRGVENITIPTNVKWFNVSHHHLLRGRLPLHWAGSPQLLYDHILDKGTSCEGALRCKCQRSECLHVPDQLSEVNFSSNWPAAKWRGELFLPAVSLAFTFCGVTNSLT